MNKKLIPFDIASDLSQLDRNFRAKRTGQCKVEYASWIFRYRRPVTGAAWAMRFAALVLMAGAIYLVAMA
jgi:hypothetical protein